MPMLMLSRRPGRRPHHMQPLMFRTHSGHRCITMTSPSAHPGACPDLHRARAARRRRCCRRAVLLHGARALDGYHARTGRRFGARSRRAIADTPICNQCSQPASQPVSQLGTHARTRSPDAPPHPRMRVRVSVSVWSCSLLGTFRNILLFRAACSERIERALLEFTIASATATAFV